MKKKNNIGAFGHPIYGKGFAKYGEMRPNSSSEIPKDLEEAAENIYKTPFGTRAEDFKAGAEWQAEQDQETIELAEDHAYLAGAVNEREKMMKEAVEGEIQMRYSGSLCAKTIRAINEDKFKFGDKVKIIIVKEDEK